MLAWNPQVGDLAAQVFRTELFQEAGLAIWNGSWYGGHYTLTYSVLFPPLASLLGPQLVGTVSVVASSYLFDRLVRDRWGDAARWATLWFAAGVVTLLADGQLTFALGVAFGLASLRALQTQRPTLALLASAACALSSPVAAAFLGGVLICASASGRDGPRGRLLPAAFVALALILVPNLVFPDAGQFPFAFSSYLAIPLWCGSALFVTRGLREEERQLRWTIAAYLLASTLVWLVPNAMGGNAVRLGALFGGPVLAAVVLARRPRVSRLVPRPLHGRRPLLAGDRERQPDRPQRRRPLDLAQLLPARRRSWLREHGGGDGADRGAADRQPLGVGLPRHPLRAGTGLAAPAGHHPRGHLLRRGPADRSRLRPLAAPERDLLRGPARRRRSTTPRSPSAA